MMSLPDRDITRCLQFSIIGKGFLYKRMCLTRISIGLYPDAR